MPELLIVGGSCFLLGALIGWVLGFHSGHAAGVETEKQRSVEKLGADFFDTLTGI